MLNGTTADADDVMDDFTELYTNIDSTNLAASAYTGTASGKFVLQTNAALATPTLNGATLAGTMAGTPTFSGAITFSSTIAVTGNAAFDTNTLFVDAAANSVGIRTITPETLLHIQNGAGGGAAINASTQLKIESSTAAAYIEFETSSTSSVGMICSDGTTFRGGVVYNHNSDRLEFTTAGATNAIINSTGDFYVGSGQKLSLNSGLTSYILESSAGVVDHYANSNLMLQVNSAIVKTKTINPFSTNTYNLGASGARYQSLYLGATSALIDMGGVTISGSLIGTTAIFNAGGADYRMDSQALFPFTNNSLTCGKAAQAWSNVYGFNAYTTTSDERTKTEIIQSDLGLDFINSLNPVSYRWKEDGVDTDLHYGFIAQQVESALGKIKAIVSYDKKADFYGLRATELLAPIVKSIQELNKKIERLNSK